MVKGLLKPIPDLLPGDCLIYNTPGSLVDFAIRLKTWSVAAHCETYIGNESKFVKYVVRSRYDPTPFFEDGFSVASRNGIGVGMYPFRKDGLIAVLRPKLVFNSDTALEWFKTVDGQKYDFLGLMCFFLAVKRGSKDRMFCSEFLKRLYEHAQCPVLQVNWDADKTAPGNYFMSTVLDWLWLQEGVTP